MTKRQLRRRIRQLESELRSARQFQLRLGQRILAAHEVLAHRAEKRS